MSYVACDGGGVIPWNLPFWWTLGGHFKSRVFSFALAEKGKLSDSGNLTSRLLYR